MAILRVYSSWLARRNAPTLSNLDYEIDACVVSDQGCCRSNNEDAVSYYKPSDFLTLKKRGALMLVADGMGGHNAGEVASKLAIDSIYYNYYANTKSKPGDSLRIACQAANKDIYSRSLHDKSLSGMGTTIAACVFVEGFMYYAHVGDSRIYRIRDGNITQLTEDHTLVIELVKKGLITKDQIESHPDRNIINRALGTRPKVSVDGAIAPNQLQLGDRYIVCSDGLHDLVTGAEMLEIGLSSSPYDVCNRLVALAKERGGYDNISTGLAHIRPPQEKLLKLPATRY